MTATHSEANQTRRQTLPRSYLVWLSGAMTSQLGNVVMYFAIAWAATAHGGAAAGLVLTAINLPRVLLLLVGGATGDRFSVWRVMVAGDAVMLFVAAVLGLVALSIGTPLWLLLVGGVAIGVVDAFYLPASGSMPRWLVDKSEVPRAVALRQTISQIIGLVGGPIGGIVVAIVGFAAAAGIDAVSFAAVLFALITIRTSVGVHTMTAAPSLLSSVADGVKVVFGLPVLRRALTMVGAMAGLLLPVSSLLVPLLVRSRGWDVAAAGWTVGGQGLGVILVSLLVLKRGPLSRPGLAAVAGTACAAVGTLFVGLSPVLPGMVAGAAITGMGMGLFMAHVSPLLLTVTPPSHLSRAQSLLILVQSTSLLVSNPILGLWSDSRGAVIATITCGLALSLVAVWGLSSAEFRTIRFERPVPDPGAPSAQPVAPPPAVAPITPREG